LSALERCDISFGRHDFEFMPQSKLQWRAVSIKYVMDIVFRNEDTVA